MSTSKPWVSRRPKTYRFRPNLIALAKNLTAFFGRSVSLAEAALWLIEPAQIRVIDTGGAVTEPSPFIFDEQTKFYWSDVDPTCLLDADELLMCERMIPLTPQEQWAIDESEMVSARNAAIARATRRGKPTCNSKF